jgi:prepilin-type N-terminal cleavage/methylation domain-containing protein
VRGRRAFTLIELLIVVGVLVALAAIALPYTTSMVERHAFESAVDAVVQQAASARAYAQREGVVVELVATEDGARVEARTVDLLAGEAGAAARTGVTGADGMDAALRGSKAAQKLRKEMERRVEAVAARVGAEAPGADADGAIHEAWATVRLAPDARAGTDAPARDDERPEFAPAQGDVRLALFLPDGSAAAVRDVWVTAGPRAGRIAIDPLLGEIRRIDE